VTREIPQRDIPLRIANGSRVRDTGGMRIGAHMSAAGGVGRAVERAVLHGCETLQIFAKNNARWAGRPIDGDEARRFRDGVAAAGLSPVVSHASYLINMAAPEGTLRQKSIEALIDEIDRADLLGLLGVVVHPGTAAPGDTDQDAIQRVADAARMALAVRSGSAAMILLEGTAGQGRALGHSFEQLAAMIDHLDGSPRIGVCLDTCHLLASGYDIASDEGYTEVMDRFSRLVGFDRLRFLHANDSKRPRGSRVDRHAHIGKGHVGVDGFRRLLHDPRLAHLAMAIETEKTPRICNHPTIIQVDPLDRMNLELLRLLRG
jgi:deoxyribonuclease-4